ncbi:hypothetical protein SALBM311S_08587 [Streptomyces alboniger]
MDAIGEIAFCRAHGHRNLVFCFRSRVFCFSVIGRGPDPSPVRAQPYPQDSSDHRRPRGRWPGSPRSPGGSGRHPRHHRRRARGLDVTLTGDTVVTVPSGTTTYDGVFRREGTLTVRGGGTLVLTRDSDFTLPKARQRQRVATPGGNIHPYVTLADPDPSGDHGRTRRDPAVRQRWDHRADRPLPVRHPRVPGSTRTTIRVDGTLRLSLRSAYNLGTISGSGLITQPRFLWGTLDLSGTHAFSGLIERHPGERRTARVRDNRCRTCARSSTRAPCDRGHCRSAGPSPWAWTSTSASTAATSTSSPGRAARSFSRASTAGPTRAATPTRH